ncbi:MAG: hypothetical protein GXP56_13315 [Deltaproteobacteria bacterium]|nr:hypothetical protein [Deltaproteobacteria bacterium]
MKNAPDLIEINNKIFKIKQLLKELETDAKKFPALSRNSKRALASIKMLELNISDILEFDLGEP